jgi:hypothetical protein
VVGVGGVGSVVGNEGGGGFVFCDSVGGEDSGMVGVGGGKGG